MTISLGKAIESLQGVVSSKLPQRHRKEIAAVLNELERLRVQNLRCVLEDHAALKAQLEIARHVSTVDLNRLAQYVYEEIGSAPEISLVMHMAGKGELVNALEKALARIGIRRVQQPDSWTVSYGHEDCAECEDMAEQAISYAKAANSASEQMVKSAFGGHHGSARRA